MKGIRPNTGKNDKAGGKVPEPTRNLLLIDVADDTADKQDHKKMKKNARPLRLEPEDA